MSRDRLLERIRAANPAPTASVTDDELFARIVAAPGDPRLVGGARSKVRRRRWVPLLAVGLVLLGAGGAAGAISLGALDHASPKALFEANPAGGFWRPGQGYISPTVIPGSVHRAATFTVPGVGRFEWWVALSRPKGWLCGAIRQPNGTWAALDTADGNRYQMGGDMPGCGTLPWQDTRGFAYDQTDVPAPGRRIWRIVYGYVPTFGHPVMVRDRVSGATARLGDGRYFAIVMPLCKARRCDTAVPPGYQLQTLDAAGGVLITDRYDPGM